MVKGIHKHHLKPRHLGGTDDPSNLLDVTYEEHALIHEARWYAYHHWADLVAWKALTKEITGGEARRLAVSFALKGKPSHRRGKKLPPEHAAKLRGVNIGRARPDMVGNKNPMHQPGVAAKVAKSQKGNPSKRKGRKFGPNARTR